MAEVDRLRGSIIDVGIKLYERRLVTGTWGNISVRHDADTVIVTPSGREYDGLKMQDVPVVNMNGEVIRGGLVPSSELPLHLAVYRARPDIGAVIHTHSIFASSCAAARKSIPPIIEDLAQVNGGSVDVAEYALPGTEAVAVNAVAALQNKQAVLLANHGVVACGKDLKEALIVCELVEKTAQIFVYAEQLGGAAALAADEVADMHKFYCEKYSRRREEK